MGTLGARRIASQIYERSVLREHLLPLMESCRAQLVASDYAFDDSVWIEPWPGHTPGHVCVIARSPQGSVILSGDVMHTALQCAEPQLNSCFCVDPEAARTTRPRDLRRWPRHGHPQPLSDPDRRLDTLTWAIIPLSLRSAPLNDPLTKWRHTARAHCTGPPSSGSETRSHAAIRGLKAR
jgi:hypothetical protein